MNDSEQVSALAADISKVINRYRAEFDITLASAIGTIEIVKLELFDAELKKSMKTIQEHRCDKCRVTFSNESGVCGCCEQDTLPASEWRPIESSPRDGTVFLAFAPHSQGGFAFSAVWNTAGRLLCMMSGDDFTGKATRWATLPELP